MTPVLLADCPQRCDELRDPDAAWESGAPDDLPPHERALWRAARAKGQAWKTRASRKLKPDGFWRHIVAVNEADASQFDGLQELLRRPDPPAHPAVCIAFAGRGFHGQHNRAWVALDGNLHLSLVLPAHMPAAPILPSLTMLPAVAAIEAIRRATHGRIEPGIKWVNDLLLDGRKIAGVLAATVINGPTIEGAVLGIGINVARTPPLPSSVVFPPASSLADKLGPDIPSLFSLLLPLLDAIGRRAVRLLAPNPHSLLGEYRRYALGIGRTVRVYEQEDASLPGNAVPALIADGILEEINPDLSLRIAGHPEPISRGRLALG